jgi:hypothetical protein
MSNAAAAIDNAPLFRMATELVMDAPSIAGNFLLGAFKTSLNVAEAVTEAGVNLTSDIKESVLASAPENPFAAALANSGCDVSHFASAAQPQDASHSVDWDHEPDGHRMRTGHEFFHSPEAVCAAR